MSKSSGMTVLIHVTKQSSAPFVGINAHIEELTLIQRVELV